MRFSIPFFLIYRQRKKKKIRFTLFSSTENWNRVIKELLTDEIKQMGRYSFTYQHTKPPLVKNLPSSEYSIKKINEEIISQSSEFNEKYYKEYWGSISNFIENGFGYCILHNGKIVSECTSIFASPQTVEIDIATAKDYRGQGLASMVAKAFIDHSLENNIIPSWDCDVSNNSSIKLAEKLGFDNPLEYAIFV